MHSRRPVARYFLALAVPTLLTMAMLPGLEGCEGEEPECPQNGEACDDVIACCDAKDVCYLGQCYRPHIVWLLMHGDGNGRVESADGQINCTRPVTPSSKCGLDAAFEGDVIELTATPEPDSVFVGWEPGNYVEGCDGANAETTVILGDDAQSRWDCTATFMLDPAGQGGGGQGGQGGDAGGAGGSGGVGGAGGGQGGAGDPCDPDIGDSSCILCLKANDCTNFVACEGASICSSDCLPCLDSGDTTNCYPPCMDTGAGSLLFTIASGTCASDC